MWFIALFLLASSAYHVAEASGGVSSCECLDICFLVDTSGSISDSEFIEIETFMANFVGSFMGPQDDILWAAVNFSLTANLVFNFDSDPPNDGDPNFNTVINYVQNMIDQQQDLTNHALGLDVVLDDVIGSAGDRNDTQCPNVVILITDGVTTTGGDPVPTANLVKATGATIIGVAVGDNTLLTTIENIASSNADGPIVFLVDSFQDLLSIVMDLREATCPSTEYDPGCQTCCCGVVTGTMKSPQPDGRSKCCGGTQYDPSKAVCCDGNLIGGFDEDWTRCCYGQPYDPRTHTCCYNQVVPSTRSQDQCCGYTAYNQKYEICCYGNVFRKGRHTKCCGSTAYNPQWYICCEYAVREGCEHDFLCCGSAAYHPNQHVCCDPYHEILADNPGKECDRDVELQCTAYDGYGVLINGGAWNPTWDTCCCGVVSSGPVNRWTGCCGGSPYNRDSQLCCDGYLRDADPKWYKCCGYDVYDPDTQTCCHGHNVLEGLGQCCGYYQLFDHCTQLCCDGHFVVEGKPHNYKCCYSYYFGYQSYNIKNELCCYGNVVKGGRHRRCCGYYSYNLRKEMCCAGRIFSRSVARLTGVCEVIDGKFTPSNFLAVPFSVMDPTLSQNMPAPTGAIPATPPITPP